MPNPVPFPTWALWRDVRRRMLLVCDYVPDIVGDIPPSEKRHKMGQIVQVTQTSRDGGRISADRVLLGVNRTLIVQAFYSIGEESRDTVTENAGRFFDDLRSAILTYQEDQYGTGDDKADGFAATYKLTFDSEPLPMGREGGYLVYELRINCGLPIGPPPPPE